MDIELMKDNFKKYADCFDTSEIAIQLKYDHSLRVMELSKMIAENIGCNKNDVEIATIIGLLHDYARFPQWEKYKTYNDLQSVDHGDLAVDLLFKENKIKKYNINKEYYDEIYDAIKYHNKYSVSSTMSIHNNLHCKIIRDADKIDILYLYSFEKSFFLEDDEIISDKVRNDFYNNKSINRNDVKNKSDKILLDLAMVYDLNYDISYKYLKNNKIIEKIFERVKNKDKYKQYFDYIIEYINRKV